MIPGFKASRGPCGYSFTIDVSNNAITRVEDDVFAIFQNCSNMSLSLADNNISFISDYAFRGLEGNIAHLNVTGNALATIPYGIGTLHKLNSLDILDNELLKLNPDTMSKLGRTLKEFFIDMSHMLHWPTELHFLRELRNLHISNIPFEHLGSSAFHGLSNLWQLTIDHSQLRKMSSAFCEFKNLDTLILTHNYNFNYSASSLFENCNGYALNLRFLIFRENDVDFIPNTIHMLNVRNVMDLQNNSMQYIDIGNWHHENKTQILALQRNRFTRIPTGLFVFEKLRDLRLSNNKISYIYDSDLEGMSHLQRLLLDGNPIRFITRHAFKDCTQLSFVNLDGTLLTEISEAITTLPMLDWLDLNGSNIECTCDMVHTQSWNISNIDFNLSKCYRTDELIEEFIKTYIDQGRC
ncbi:leucine-rich repeats and immunoglobulin-like domains protein 3 isoform X2 [Dreissena polymorpha]|nr:leucine-rich repeats and immunoglobulin-like domains protein 3 isoform X2 [Dreissena polymorpha]